MLKLLYVGVVFVTIGIVSSAKAEPNCNIFRANPDGSWSPTLVYVFKTPSSQQEFLPSSRMLPNMPGVQGWIARYLNARCRFEQPNEAERRIPRIP
jgi:hypothetical protein